MAKSNIQTRSRRETFSTSQYWNLHYTEKYDDGSEKDFKTIIKARSYSIAKQILREKISGDDPTVAVKALQGFILHKRYRSITGKSLGINEWCQIRSAAFPNENNILFKIEVERPPDKTNRFNTTNYDQLKTIGFSKGADNWSSKHIKGKTLPEEDRVGKIYKGKWIEWDRPLRTKARNQLIYSLIKHDNNRSRVARELGVCRNKIYALFKRFPEINWAEEYPPSKRGPSAS